MAGLPLSFQHITTSGADSAGFNYPFPDWAIRSFDQIEYIHSQVAHDVVGSLDRKSALSMQNIVHVRLGDPNHPSQAALGEFAVANTVSKQGDKSLLEVAEGHDGLAAIFLSEIGGYRICTCRFWKSIINQNQ